MSRPAAKGGLEEVLADGAVTTDQDQWGITARLSKTGGSDAAWTTGMLLSWHHQGRSIWALFVLPDRPGGSVMRFWPTRRDARAQWKKQNPPSPLHRLARSLILPTDLMEEVHLHQLLLLQAVLHGVQEGLVDLTTDPGAGRLYDEHFSAMAKRLYRPRGLHEHELHDVIYDAYKKLYRSGPRRGFLGAHHASSFPAYVRTKLRAAGGQALRERAFGARVESSEDPSAVGVPPGLREAGVMLGVSKSTVDRHLKQLGHHALDAESWPAVVDSITTKAEWRELQDRLVHESGLTNGAARKRVYRHKTAGRGPTDAARLEFPDGTGPTQHEAVAADQWEALVTYLVEAKGYTQSAAEVAMSDLRDQGYDTPKAATPRVLGFAALEPPTGE